MKSWTGWHRVIKNSWAPTTSWLDSAVIMFPTRSSQTLESVLLLPGGLTCNAAPTRSADTLTSFASLRIHHAAFVATSKMVRNQVLAGKEFVIRQISVDKVHNYAQHQYTQWALGSNQALTLSKQLVHVAHNVYWGVSIILGVLMSLAELHESSQVAIAALAMPQLSPRVDAVRPPALVPGTSSLVVAQQLYLRLFAHVNRLRLWRHHRLSR